MDFQAAPMEFREGERVATRRDLMFGIGSTRKILPAGSTGTVITPGPYRSNVRVDGDRVRRFDNPDLRSLDS